MPIPNYVIPLMGITLLPNKYPAKQLRKIKMIAMNFIGLWKNRSTEEFIKISHIENGDNYLLEYDKDFKTSEVINIFRSQPQDKHAIIPASKKFGRQDIYILTSISLKIGKEVFDQQEDKK